MKKTLFCALSTFLLTSCINNVSFARVSYDDTLAMATCGNVLNPDIYSPDSGPDGFVSYRSYFEKRIELRLQRDFSCELTYRINGESDTAYHGKYESQSANSGQMYLHFETEEFVLRWLNYYQMVFECNITNPNTGETLSAVALLHSSNIFTT